jgi:Phosphotransferase enzyme family
MRGLLGEKIGEGATADIHVWAPGQIVKLFKVGASPRFGRHEARMTRAAFAAGAPEVIDEVTVEGRFGIVLQRLDGPTLLQLLQTRAVTSEQVGAILATLYTSVHKTPPPPDVVSLRDWIDAVSRTSRDILPEHIATGVLSLIDHLPPENGLCHADLHPGNVIMTADGPRIIGRRKHRHFQRLTSNIGYPKLREHLGAVVATMKLSTDWHDFRAKLDKNYPRKGKPTQLSFDYSGDDEEDDGRGL